MERSLGHWAVMAGVKYSVKGFFVVVVLLIGLAHTFHIYILHLEMTLCLWRSSGVLL